MNTHKYITIIFVLFINCTIFAQDLSTSYFVNSAPFRHQLNPALLEESSNRLSFLIGKINVGTTGNFGISNFIYDNPVGGKEYTTFMNPAISADDFLNDLDDKTHLNVDFDYNLMSVVFKGFKGTNIVELNMKSHSTLCLPYELFDFMKRTGSKSYYSFDDFGFRSQSYLELGLGHSHKIGKNLTVGGKLKVLLGASYAEMNVDHMDVTMNGNQWIVNSDATLNAAILKSEFKYKDNPDPATTKPGMKKVKGLDNVKFGLPGFGLAVDLGAKYNIPTVKGLSVSASINDLGFISWSDTKKAQSAGKYTFNGFNNIYVNGTNTGHNKLSDQVDDLTDDLDSLFSLYDAGTGKKTKSLAATMRIGAEYVMPFYDKLSVGFLLTDRFDGIYSWHQGMLSANVRPLNWLDITLNAATSTTGWTTGGMFTIHTKSAGTCFYIAMDRFMGKLSKQFVPINNCNTSVCAGLTFGL